KPNFPLGKMLSIALIVYRHSQPDSEERREALQILSNLLNWPGLTILEILRLIERFDENRIHELRVQSITILTELSKQPNLIFEHTTRVAETLHKYNDPEARSYAFQILLDLA